MKTAWYEAKLWSGMDFFGWTRLLLGNRLAVSFTRIPMALTLTGMSAVNSVLRGAQWAWYGRRVSRVAVPDDPVFVIGHWRTGTTMMHELLGLDPRNRCPTTYECLSPCHFLLTEGVVRRWLWFLLPRRRPMDNVRVGFDRPQEDEAALCNLGRPSPFLTVAFPNRPPQHPRYVDFDALSDAELAGWERALRRFLQHVLYKRPGRAVLKSPQHTFRVRHIVRAFPQARFVHLVRDPYVVFPSTVHFWRQMYDAYGLQRPTYAGLEEHVLSNFEHMQRQLEAARRLIPDNRIYELKYEDLVEDPAAHMERIYDHLQLGDFEPVRSAVEQYGRKRYKPNVFEDLPAETRQQIADRWGDYFDRYGYQR